MKATCPNCKVELSASTEMVRLMVGDGLLRGKLGCGECGFDLVAAVRDLNAQIRRAEYRLTDFSRWGDEKNIERTRNELRVLRQRHENLFDGGDAR